MERFVDFPMLSALGDKYKSFGGARADPPGQQSEQVPSQALAVRLIRSMTIRWNVLRRDYAEHFIFHTRRQSLERTQET